MPDFAVLLHARNVLIADDQNSVRSGGMYAWRRVTAPDSEAAGEIAARKLLHEKELRDEVWNKFLGDICVVAEEVDCLEAADTEFSDSGYVFYIEEAEKEVRADSR